MKLELYSERLFLRPLCEDDFDMMLALTTNPDVMKFVATPRTKEEATHNFTYRLNRCGLGCIGIWCIIEQATGEKLGTTALLGMPIEQENRNWEYEFNDPIPDGDIEIGYLLNKPAWGKGYASEAAGRLLQFAFEDTPLKEVVATLDDENNNSRNVLQKIGLREVGRRFAYGEENCADFRITKRQWLNLNET